MLSDIHRISSLLEDWVRAVCKGDREAVAALWSSPGLVVEPEGAAAVGSDAALAMEIMPLCGPGCPDCTHLMQIERYHMIAPGVASVTITPRPESQFPEGCPLRPATFVVAREGEDWRLKFMALGQCD